MDPTKENTYYRVFGSPENNCPQISFHNPKDYLYLPSTGKDLFDVPIRFRIYFANATLAYKGNLNLQCVSLSLIEGKVVIKVQVSSVIQFSQGKSLNNGEWHTLSAVVSKTEIELKLDQLVRKLHKTKWRSAGQ